MREDKNLLLEEIKGQIEHFGSFVIMSYEGLTANAANKFRGQVAKHGGSIEMVPKRVLIQAATRAGITLEKEKLPGHISMVFTGPEPFETAKTVCQFKKDNDKQIKVLGGRFEGQLYKGEEVERIATLPSKDEMRAQFVGLLEAPMSHTISTMEAALSTIILCLENKAKKSEGN